ncbi:hypothetical protein ACEZCY_18040 [Streptacidiphilus sp. N1-12]|uniref:Uncharacterized protein n=1 Tax=Streptacidiphilus alkalitolerans TaxID=3342712 RepID=A0ABV6X0Q2_9ACTN
MDADRGCDGDDGEEQSAHSGQEMTAVHISSILLQRFSVSGGRPTAGTDSFPAWIELQGPLRAISMNRMMMRGGNTAWGNKQDPTE